MIRRRSSSPTSPALLPDDDDLLREILLRLPPQPSSLPRAFLVCKRWRSLVSDPVFLRRFRTHHRKPPLLGLFSGEFGIPVFNPALDPPDRIPSARFSMPQRRDESWMLLDSRHGLALLRNRKRLEAVMWDPITGGQRCVPFPPELEFNYNEGNDTVLCAAGDDGHVHGGCHLSPFKLVLVRSNADSARAFASLYESGSGVWGNFMSTEVTSSIYMRPSILVGNALCWLLIRPGILEFDLDTQSLAVIEKPADVCHTNTIDFQIHFVRL